MPNFHMRILGKTTSHFNMEKPNMKDKWVMCEKTKASDFRKTVNVVSRTLMVTENFYCPIILIKINRYRYL